MNETLLIKLKNLSNVTVKKLYKASDEITSSSTMLIRRTRGPRQNDGRKKQRLKAQLKDL
ncbi:hypothetical protein JOD29_002408 [Lysinibacillus composti]|nr:hypothetical protein [Lysinibacillus composti]